MSEGPRHAYVPATAGCWEVFGQVQADEMTRFGYPDAHGWVVDAYMASHPGPGDDPRDARSVVMHLLALHARVYQGMESATVRRLVMSPGRVADDVASGPVDSHGGLHGGGSGLCRLRRAGASLGHGRVGVVG